MRLESKSKVQVPISTEQFPNNFYTSGDMLFCKFCRHTVYWKRVHTCKDHLQYKAHVKNMKKHRAAAADASRVTMPLQTTKLKWKKWNMGKNKMDFIGPYKR